MNKLIFTLLSIILISGCTRHSESAEYSKTVALMGTFVQIKSASGDVSRNTLAEIVDGAVTKARVLEEKFDIFNANSEINALNIAKRKKVSSELFKLIEESKKIGGIAGGEFDITVTPILKKEGFYGNMPEELRNKIPDTFDGVGWENVLLYPETNEIVLLNGAWLDLSGIAKGYIVDKISEFLKKEGITEFLVNAGGDIYCGNKNGNDVWRIGIRKPVMKFSERPDQHYILVTLGIKNMAIATSGDYENIVIEDNGKSALSHIIDPSIEKSKVEVPSSITVIAPTCREADALATGMMAMGRERAVKLADTLRDVEIIAVENTKGHTETSFSRYALKYVKRKL